jgi:hypothetical protein
MESYNYNINQFNITQLMDEVDLSLNKKLYFKNEGDIVDGYCDTLDTLVIFNFYSGLTLGEINILDSVVSNYVYNPNYAESKYFKINQSTNNPSTLDYDILGFNKKRTIVTGELRLVEYYKNYDASANTYSDLVVVETRDYTRDEIGIAKYRNLSSNWLLNDGTTGLTINSTKYYTPEEGIQEGLDRRGNMIGFAKTALLSGLKDIYGEPTNQTYAFDLLLGVKTQIDYFIQGYTQPLRDVVSASTKPYMTVGIKEAVIQQLQF